MDGKIVLTGIEEIKKKTHKKSKSSGESSNKEMRSLLKLSEQKKEEDTGSCRFAERWNIESEVIESAEEDS